MGLRSLGALDASLTEQLPYWALRDGAMLLADGRLEVGLEVRVPSTTLGDEDVWVRMHRAFAAALRHGVPQGERLRVLLEVAPSRLETVETYETGAGPDAIHHFRAARVRQFRQARDAGQLVEHRCFVTCTLKPARLELRRGRHRSRTAIEWPSRAEEAQTLRANLANLLERAGLEAAPLGDQDLFELAWRYYNPGLSNGPSPRLHAPQVFLPEWLLRQHPDHAQPTVRSQLLSGDLLRLWSRLQILETHLRVVTMANLPVGETVTGMLGHLQHLPCRGWLVLDLVHKPQGLAQRSLMAQARRLHAASGDSGGFSDYADPEVRVGASQTDEALLERSLTGSHAFDVGLGLVLQGTSLAEVNAASEAAVGAFAQWPGVNAVVESVGLLTQFLKLAPLSGGANERLCLCFEENAADLMPYNAPWRGSANPVCLFFNRWDGLTTLDPFDPASRNWNAIFVGASGSGKTFLAQSMLGELLDRDLEAVIVDRGAGYEALVKFFGGHAIPIEPGSVSINPFDLAEGELEPGDEKKAFLLALLGAMLGERPRGEAALERAILGAAIGQTYARATIERRVGGAVRREYAGARLSDLARVLVTLEQIGERAASPREREVARALALELQPWLGDGTFGSFLDRPTDLPGSEAQLTCFETSAFERHPELATVGLLLIADLVWRRVRRDPARRKVVVLDEAWSLLKQPEAAAFVTELYRRFRRYNAAVWAVTQSLEDFATEMARGILQNTTYHYLLPLPGEDALVAELLRLSPCAMEVFRGLSGQRGTFGETLCWVQREDALEGDVLVVRPTPLEYWAYTSHAADVAERERIVARHGGRLVPALLELAERWPRGWT